MFGLLYGLYQSFTKKREHRVLLLGLDNAGKTTTLEQIRRQLRPGTEGGGGQIKTLPTIGFNGRFVKDFNIILEKVFNFLVIEKISLICSAFLTRM